MPSANILLTNAGSPVPVSLALHRDEVLSGRKGYDENFLGIKVPLPIPETSLQNALAEVYTGIGPNGKHVLDYTHFSVMYHKKKQLPVCTAVNIDGRTNLIGLPHEERSGDSWDPDDRIKEGSNSFQFGNADYRGTKFQKGHMVRYFDPAWGKTQAIKETAMLDTFYYTNCCPQVAYYNAVVWNYLEDYYIARAVFQDKKITVFSGPVFNKAKMIGNLLVPMNFWKVVVYKKGDKPGALGFIMSHERYLKKLKDDELELVKPTLKKEDIERLYKKKEIIDAKVKIKFIEEKTGITFNLNDADENRDEERLFHELISPVSGADNVTPELNALPAQNDMSILKLLDEL